MVLYPNFPDPEVGYIRMATDYLPAAFRGLMLAAFLAAYMSTISTQLNWASSYFVNDFYRRFLAAGRSEQHYVLVSRFATMGMMMLGACVSFYMQSIGNAWLLLMNIGAGTGAVYLLRWYWWRINAWSEISAMATAFIVATWMQFGVEFSGPENVIFANKILSTVAITTVVWLMVTFLTQAEPTEKLVYFYRRVRPTVWGWQPIADLAPEISPDQEGWYNLKYWILGCLLVYLSMFSIGTLLLGNPWVALGLAVGAGLAGLRLCRDFSRRGWS